VNSRGPQKKLVRVLADKTDLRERLAETVLARNLFARGQFMEMSGRLATSLSGGAPAGTI
jgi:hypothetical protein